MRCIEKKCFRSASFGPIGENTKRCEIHRIDGDINPVDIVCEINKCQSSPTYGDGIRRYRCGLHRKYTDKKMGKFMDGVSFCTVQGCPFIREYGINGDIMRCENHKLEGDSVRTKPRCIVEGCNDQNVLYKKAGTKTNTHCYNHKPYGYVSSKLIICIEGECFTSARFGDINDGIKLHCYDHRGIDEMNLSMNKCCEVRDCIRDRTFGPPRATKVRCELHRINGDIGPVLNRTCSSPMCSSRPSFGPPGGVISTCSKHRLMDYVNLKTPSCHGDGSNIVCDKMPTFGIPNGRRVHCSKHACEGEINLVRKRCSAFGCDVQPTFGPVKWKRRRCGRHKKVNDIYAVGKRMHSKYTPEIQEVTLDDSLFDENIDMIFESGDLEFDSLSDDENIFRETSLLEFDKNMDKVFGEYDENIEFSGFLV